MLKNIRLFVAGAAYVFISCTALVGCGTKGPLYIPEQRYPQKPIPQDESIKANPEANTNVPPQPAQ
jgi:predicted small lipoprotein YifL